MFESDYNEWQSMLGGNKNAFLTIYNKYYKSLFQYGFSLTRDKEFTKDAIQELFLEIWNTRTTVNKTVQNTRAYLFTWLRRKISHIIALRIKEKFSENKAELFDFEEDSYEKLLIAFQNTEEKKAKLAKALKKLTKKQLEIIRLKFFYNLSYTEIAAKTSLSTRTVYNTIYEALHLLREDVSLLV
ncbi:MAG TPA: sigma-70 family RNA polymerase sigma factor [Flavisolibacter sp.]|nr:sigma-70 family RNA polymerase sigma factor [Flavisolibacter sp.]